MISGRLLVFLTFNVFQNFTFGPLAPSFMEFVSKLKKLAMPIQSDPVGAKMELLRCSYRSGIPVRRIPIVENIFFATKIMWPKLTPEDQDIWNLGVRWVPFRYANLAQKALTGGAAYVDP